MYIHNLNPVLLDFGIIEIRWYSLAYIFGILLGWWLGKKLLIFKIQSNNSIEIKIFDDLISYLILGIIIGGRIGYVIFYNLGFYLKNPFDIFKIWEGGMSFHGALIGVILTTYYFCDKKRHSLFFLDIIACVAPIGLFFGRITNFINAELYGKPSDLFFAVIFPTVDNIPRHPSQLYEAFLEGIVLFVILISIFYSKKIKTGTCSSLFLIFYGFFRMISEYFREPDIQVGYIFYQISMGSLLSFVMVLLGLTLFFKIKKNDFNK